MLAGFGSVDVELTYLIRWLWFPMTAFVSGLSTAFFAARQLALLLAPVAGGVAGRRLRGCLRVQLELFFNLLHALVQPVHKHANTRWGLLPVLFGDAEVIGGEVFFAHAQTLTINPALRYRLNRYIRSKVPFLLHVLK